VLVDEVEDERCETQIVCEVNDNERSRESKA
jgi:hypothetical protein